MFILSTDLDIILLGKYNSHIIASDEVIGGINQSSKIHNGGTVYSGEDDLQIPLCKMSVEMLIEQEVVLGYDIHAFSKKIYDLSRNLADEMTKTLFDTMGKVTEHTGNVVDGKGESLSIEMILEVLNKIHIDFDDEGNPKLPTIIVHPSMQEKIMKLKDREEEFKARVDDIIKRKKEEYYARKGHRGLSRID